MITILNQTPRFLRVPLSRGKVLLVADIKQISEHIAAKKCVPHFSSRTVPTHATRCLPPCPALGPSPFLGVHVRRRAGVPRECSASGWRTMQCTSSSS